MRPRLGSAVLVMLVAACVFAVALQGVLSGGGLALLDRPAQGLFLGHRQSWVTGLLRAATNLGSSALLWPLTLAAGLALRWRRGTWRPLVLLAAALLGVSLLTDVVKFLVARPRPLPGPSGDFSFPSGHTSQATAFYGMAAALAAAGSRRRRVVTWIAAGLVIVVVALSRIYLGRHWLTDVVGGSALGVVWMFVLLTLSHPKVTAASRPPAGAGPPAQELDPARPLQPPSSRPPGKRGVEERPR